MLGKEKSKGQAGEVAMERGAVAIAGAWERGYGEAGMRVGMRMRRMKMKIERRRMKMRGRGNLLVGAI